MCQQGLRARDDRTLRPWRIDAVYLFDAQARLAQQRGRGVKTGVAAGLRAEQWEAAEIYPAQTCEALVLSDQQQEQLRLFAATEPWARPRARTGLRSPQVSGV